MYANLMAMVGNASLAEAALKVPLTATNVSKLAAGRSQTQPLALRGADDSYQHLRSDWEICMSWLLWQSVHIWQAEALDMFKQAETAAQQGDGASLKGRRATIASVKVRCALLLR
jgi:hypothetical protein